MHAVYAMCHNKARHEGMHPRGLVGGSLSRGIRGVGALLRAPRPNTTNAPDTNRPRQWSGWTLCPTNNPDDFCSAFVALSLVVRLTNRRRRLTDGGWRMTGGSWKGMGRSSRGRSLGKKKRTNPCV